MQYLSRPIAIILVLNNNSYHSYYLYLGRYPDTIDTNSVLHGITPKNITVYDIVKRLTYTWSTYSIYISCIKEVVYGRAAQRYHV